MIPDEWRSRKIQPGDVFGRLTVLQFQQGTKESPGFYICQCECGNKTKAHSTDLKSGLKRSCGCLQREVCKITGKKSCTHNMSHTRLYRTWRGIKTRCSKTTKCNSKNYSDRGIKMCEEWNDFENFMKWAYETGYTDELTIDRIDVNGDYCPENCRWLTNFEQQSNKRTNVKIAYNGKTQTIAQWSRETGISFALIHWRYVSGKTGSDLFKKPYSPRTITYNGETKTIKEWANTYGVQIGMIYGRLYSGRDEGTIFDDLKEVDK